MGNKLVDMAGYVARSTYVVPGGYYVSSFLMKLFKNKEKRQFKFEGINFSVDTNTYLGSKMFWRGAHSWPPIFALRDHVKPGFVCIDIGANQGEYTMWMSKMAGKGGKVVSYEPLTKMYALLQENIRINKIAAENVTPVQIGLGNEECVVPIYWNKDGVDTINEGTPSIFKDGEQDTMVEQIQIKESGKAIRELIKGKIDFIKIDVEGSEMRVLQGMTDLLEKYMPIMLIELNRRALNLAETSPEAVAKFLSDMGYKLYVIKQRGVLESMLTDDAKSFIDENIIAKKD